MAGFVALLVVLALALLASAIVRRRLAARVRLARAAALYQRGAYAEALAQLAPLLAHPRWGARAHFASGACLVRLGRLPEAAQHFRAAVSRGLAEAQGALGAALVGAGRLDEAEPILRSVARQGDAEAHVLLASIAEKRGDTQGALLDLLIATSLAPRDPDAWAALGALYCRLGRHERAEAALGRAIELDPTHRDALLALVERRVRSGDRAGARQAAQRLLTYHGADPTVRQTLAALGLLPPTSSKKKAS